MPPFKERIKKICLFCNNLFLAIPSEVYRGGGKFCSQKCYRNFKKNDRTKKTFVRCYICNSEINIFPNRLKYSKRFFCSKICASKWRSKFVKSYNFGVERLGKKLSLETRT